jgi:hypothetical protein
MDTTHPLDDEESRLFGLYEASSAKEHAATSKLLNPHHRLSDAAYIKQLADLQVIRTECNEGMLAITTNHEKMREHPTAH